jgi:hypothetical protein
MNNPDWITEKMDNGTKRIPEKTDSGKKRIPEKRIPEKMDSGKNLIGSFKMNGFRKKLELGEA